MVLTAVLLIGSVVPTSAALADSNYGDTWYSSYATSRGVTYTDARDKKDRTSSWDACWYGANHTVEVAACKDDTWNVLFVGSPIYGWWANKSGYLVNYVGENNCKRALLWFNNTNSYDVTLQGYWSPDSIQI